MTASPRALRASLLLIALLALAGGLVIVWAMPFGPAAASDSAAYFAAARNVVAGHGLGVFRPSGPLYPWVAFPPLYPWALAGLFGAGLDELAAVRGLNAALFAGMVFSGGALLLRATRRPGLAVLYALALLTSPLMVGLFTAAISEPLYLFTGLASFGLVAVYLRESRRPLLLAAGLAAGLAAITRYQGLVFGALAPLAALLAPGLTIRRRLSDMMLSGLLAFGPPAAWLLWVQLKPSAGAPRRLSLLPALSWEGLRPVRGGLVDTFWGWVPGTAWLPEPTYRVRLAVVAVLAAALLALLIAALWAGRRAAGAEGAHGLRSLAALSAVFIAGQIAFVTAAYLLVFPPPGIHQRTFSPVQPILALLALSAAGSLPGAGRAARLARAAAAAAVLVFVAGSLPASAARIAALQRDGVGYTSASWRNSATVAAVRAMPESVPLISNESAALLFYTNRTAYDLQELNDAVPLEGFPRYGDDLHDDAQRVFRQERGRLVLFRSIYWQLHPIYGDRTAERLEALTAGLVVVQEFPDAVVFAYPEVDD